MINNLVLEDWSNQIYYLKRLHAAVLTVGLKAGQSSQPYIGVNLAAF